MRESSYVRSRRTTACGGTVFRHAEANGPGGRAPGLSDQAVTGTLAGKGFPVCWPYGQTGGADAFLEVASQPFAGGTISRCWHILFTR